MKRVLFVDDEPNILQGLRRMLRGMRKEWEMDFQPSAREGLAAMDQRPFDIVISDMKMPGMDGAEFLTEIKNRYPDTIRIILSGHSEKEAILKSVGPTHQFLAKPCEPEVVKKTIERACALRDLMRNDQLKELVAKMDSLPSLPSLYKEVIDEIQKPNSSLEKIGEVIERDIGMSAKILKLVNSAYFGLLRPVNSVPRAVTFLGLETINALVLGAKIFQEYEGEDIKGFSLEELWDHSFSTASFTRAICATEEMDKLAADDAFMAGMLHEIGKLVLVSNDLEDYGQVMELVEQGKRVSEAELEVLGTTHAEVGAYLVGLWGLPDSIVETVAYHVQPCKSVLGEFAPLTAVHVADRLTRELADPATYEDSTAVNVDYLRDIGMEERLPVWRDACREVLERGGPEQ